MLERRIVEGPFLNLLDIVPDGRMVFPKRLTDFLIGDIPPFAGEIPGNLSCEGYLTCPYLTFQLCFRQGIVIRYFLDD